MQLLLENFEDHCSGLRNINSVSQMTVSFYLDDDAYVLKQKT